MNISKDLRTVVIGDDESWKMRCECVKWLWLMFIFLFVNNDFQALDLLLTLNWNILEFCLQHRISQSIQYTLYFYSGCVTYLFRFRLINLCHSLRLFVVFILKITRTQKTYGCDWSYVYDISGKFTYFSCYFFFFFCWTQFCLINRHLFLLVQFYRNLGRPEMSLYRER